MRTTPLVSSALVALTTIIATPLHAAAPAFHKVTKQELPAAIKPAGELIDAVAWSDAAGHNVAAFFLKIDEKKNTSKLQVTFWSGTPGTKGIVMRTIKDGVSGCDDADMWTKFVPEALKLTDLDEDGYGELTFAYRMTCTTDVSPWSLKLLMLERRDKYVVRGDTRIDAGDGPVGGEHKADPELNGVPKFLHHAEQVWAAIMDQPPT